MTKHKEITMLLVFILISAIAAFIFIEGFCSAILFFSSIHLPGAESKYTQYDEQLGWVNIPNIFIKNMYGNGVYIRTNSQGFRNNVDAPVFVAKDKIRIICSGDSFTLGYGVDNDHTWCQLLTSFDKRLETINMGQGGYGFDQAYLWYMRDGIKLEHQVHIFGFIKNDFSRLGDKYHGYDKPFFKLENESLVLCNVPVPKRSFIVPWLTENIGTINGLRSVQLLSRAHSNADLDKTDASLSERGRKIVLKIFEDLLRVNKLKNSVLIIVYLPTKPEVTRENKSSLELKAFLNSELPKRGLVFIDLCDDFTRLPADEINEMFIDTIKYYNSKGHYSVKGNQYVAGILYKKLSPYLASRPVKIQ